MAKSTPFSCDTCGQSGSQPCIVGKKGSSTWKKKLPLGGWHRSRTENLKKFKQLLQKAQTDT